MNATEALNDRLQAAPSGDARVLYFDVRDGFREKVLRYLQEWFGQRFVVVTTD